MAMIMIANVMNPRKNEPENNQPHTITITIAITRRSDCEKISLVNKRNFKFHTSNPTTRTPASLKKKWAEHHDECRFNRSCWSSHNQYLDKSILIPILPKF